MKNNIIIAGVPRAGKSTISHSISKKLGFQHISMDSIIAGLERAFPETQIDTHSSLPPLDNMRKISGKIAPFIKAMLDSGEYDEFKPGMVLDVYQLLPEDYIRYIAGSNCDIFYFITADVTPKERFAILKAYDTENDYTYYKPNDELRAACAAMVEHSQFIREQCITHNLPFYETSKDREKVIERFIQSLSEQTELSKNY